MLKRMIDFFIALLALLLLLPVFLVVSVFVWFDDGFPIFFSQIRVGKDGKLFKIYKFRSMRVETHPGRLVTVGGDLRVTRVGVWLRKYKLDELPQLFNVLLGNMSFVGPRPEVPFYMSKVPIEKSKIVLSVRPGITDTASLRFIDESGLLACASDPDREYVEKILPMKIEMAIKYVENRSLLGDIQLIGLTVVKIFLGRS